jgi:hypothetical protein
MTKTRAERATQRGPRGDSPLLTGPSDLDVQ